MRLASAVYDKNDVVNYALGHTQLWELELESELESSRVC